MVNMPIKVFHLKDEYQRVRLAVGRADFLTANILQERYRYTAVVLVPFATREEREATPIEQVLDEVFRLTNGQFQEMGAWYTNHERIMWSCDGEKRSTSVGDIMMVPGQKFAWVVMKQGWRRIPFIPFS